MNPAFSVIFFSTFSGFGYGLMAWAAAGAILGCAPRALLIALALGLVSATAGLLASLGHLGKPLRAWRAFSQWRTSWLSREGVAAVITYVPALALAAVLLPGMITARDSGAPAPLSAAGIAVAVVLIFCAMATVACTAMIYACLKPIPAWRHHLVVPGYLAFALVTGGLAMLAINAMFASTPRASFLLAAAGLVAIAILKLRYWRDLRTLAMPATRGSAVGLPDRDVTLFERPHTEGNFLTREMVFVLARKHALMLQRIALLLFAVVPLACVGIAAVEQVAWPWLGAATASMLAGAVVERWLFFAQARHVVSLYY